MPGTKISAMMGLPWGSPSELGAESTFLVGFLNLPSGPKGRVAKKASASNVRFMLFCCLVRFWLCTGIFVSLGFHWNLLLGARSEIALMKIVAAVVFGGVVDSSGSNELDILSGNVLNCRS